MIPLEKHIVIEYERRHGSITTQHPRKYRRLEYIRWMLTGRCVNCGKSRYAFHSKCYVCHTRAREGLKKIYAKRKENVTVCNRCGGPMEKDDIGKFNCSDCREDTSIRRGCGG